MTIRPAWGPLEEHDAADGFGPGCETAWTANGGPCKVVSGGYTLHAADCPNLPTATVHVAVRLPARLEYVDMTFTGARP